MAQIDASFLLTDPDFADAVTLIRRAVTINGYGEGVIAETPSTITAVVQGANTETLARIPDGARLSDLIEVYYRGVLTVERTGGYADVIIWHGRRYQVFEVVEDFMNYGSGFTKAVCKLEPVNA